MTERGQFAGTNSLGHGGHLARAPSYGGMSRMSPGDISMEQGTLVHVKQSQTGSLRDPSGKGILA